MLVLRHCTGSFCSCLTSVANFKAQEKAVEVALGDFFILVLLFGVFFFLFF